MGAMGWNEAELLRWIARRPRARALSGSQGHDAAVLRALRGRPVVCADQVVEGVHAEFDCAGRALGRKAAGHGIAGILWADLAATAAQPVALVLCIAAPLAERASRLRALIEGVDEKAHEHGAELVAGDLSSSRGPLSITVTALGRFAGRGRPPGRDRARAGELVLVTGPLGGSRLGRHLDPAPRFAEAAFLLANGARALMDVSDGLALDLSRLAAASGVRLELERVPVHADARRLAQRSGHAARAHALTDGEDHELLATLAPRRWRAVEREAARRFPRLGVIGRVHAGRGLAVADEDGGALRAWDGKGGWIHGG